MSYIDALRFDTPLYTVSEAASIVGVPPSTPWRAGPRATRERPLAALR